MNKMTKEQKHLQCVREIRWTLIVTGVCCAWHTITAFALNGSGLYFIGMPAWFSVSVFGTVILALAGAWFLTKKIFIDFDYDDESVEEGGGKQ